MARFSFLKNYTEYNVDIDLRKFLENHFLCYKKSAPHIDEIVDIINSVFPQYISEDEISAQIKRDKKTVQRIFMSAFGIKYKYLVKTFRIYCSLILLYKARLDLTDLAINLNYSDLSNMDRDFQKVLGITPSRASAELKHLSPDKLFGRYYRNRRLF